MHDPFVGTWTLDASGSRLDPHHRPADAVMRWQLEDDGGYLMLAEGTSDSGEHCVEKPQKLFPDGRSCDVENLPGLTCVTRRTTPNAIRAEVRREDGSLAGEASYEVADDGFSMTATTAGFDSQLRRFEMTTVWRRV